MDDSQLHTVADIKDRLYERLESVVAFIREQDEAYDEYKSVGSIIKKDEEVFIRNLLHYMEQYSL